jgi:cellulose synthase/poly-beta-1,6-N-acetylglucosamine synthase-like glycosyltransferase
MTWLRHYAAVGMSVFELSVLAYFLLLHSLYLIFSAVALVVLSRHRLRWTSRELGAVMRSPATPGISVIVPAHNEERTIGESVRSLLLLNYPQFEVVVVNDGSTDLTLGALIETFGMLPAPASYPQSIATQPVTAFYRSLEHPDLAALDKVNGGKADAINAGINAARYALVCVIDADSILEAHALTRAVLPFIEDPDTLASGGIVRIVNGCEVDTGRVTAVHLPRSPLALFQVVEYLRAFLAGRVALSAGNLLLIISGAFGVFRRGAVVDVGGFRTDTVGEDMDIVTRLHRQARAQRRRYRIVFQAEPVCWTQVPESPRILGNQRGRWQRGTLETILAHRAMLVNPRYGAIGLFAMPYYLVFETLGPVIEFVGLLVVVLAAALGALDVWFAELLFLVAVAYGAIISVLAVLLEELSYRRYARARDLVVLCIVAVAENFGYRQLTTWWRLKGTLDFFRHKRGWGTMTRKEFSSP